MQNKIKMKYFVILYFTLIISAEILPAEEADKNKFLATANTEENQCDSYAYKVVRPLLDNFQEIQNKLKNHNKIIENKDKALQVKVAEKDKIIESYKILGDLNTVKFDLLEDKMQQLTKTARFESDQLAELNRTVAAYSKTIADQNSQIIKLQAQIELDSKRLQKYEDQLSISTDLIREKSEKIIDQLQNITYFAKKTQFELEDFKKFSIEGRVDSCLPFATSPGFHTIKVPGINPFNVLCQNTATGAGWIVIQQRINGKENFQRTWAGYRDGFGSLSGDFFLGLEKIYRLTTDRRHELYIHLERFSGEVTYATYEHFEIADEEARYNLINVDGFSGNTTDSIDRMNFHKYTNFNTFDKHSRYGWHPLSGWWTLGGCNLNGQYFDHEVNDSTAIVWYPNSSLKKVQMLIRPKFN